MTSPTDSQIITDGQGEARWWGDGLAVIKIAEPGGEPTMIEATFAPGDSPPAAYSTKYNLNLFGLEGEVDWTVADQTFPLRTGDSLSIPRGERMEVRVGQEGSTSSPPMGTSWPEP